MHWSQAFIWFLWKIGEDKKIHKNKEENINLALEMWKKFEEMAEKYGVGEGLYWNWDFFIKLISSIDDSLANFIQNEKSVKTNKNDNIEF